MIYEEEVKNDNKDLITEYSSKIHQLKGQIKLQELIIEIYHSQIKDKTLWTKIISKFMP